MKFNIICLLIINLFFTSYSFSNIRSSAVSEKGKTFVYCKIKPKGFFSVYFEEDESQLSYEQEDRLVSYLNRLRNINKVYLESHTDACGGDNYNKRLSQDRNKEVKSFIKSNSNKKVELLASHGESYSYGHNHSDKRVEIKYKNPVNYVYLIDGSASLNSSRTYRGYFWKKNNVNSHNYAIQDYSFAPNANIWIIRGYDGRKRLGCSTTGKFSSYRPEGDTYIYDALYKTVVGLKTRNTHIIVFSDGIQSSFTGKNHADLSSWINYKAKKLGLRVTYL